LLRASAEVGGDVVDVTVGPGLARFGAPDQMVIELHMMFSGVSVGRRIAASDMAADEAHPEMDPPVSGLQAFLAAGDLVRYWQDFDSLVVFAPWHGFPFSSV
jgi:hypothetical protein